MLDYSGGPVPNSTSRGRKAQQPTGLAMFALSVTFAPAIGPTPLALVGPVGW
jgi:hypothetical protein